MHAWWRSNFWEDKHAWAVAPTASHWQQGVRGTNDKNGDYWCVGWSWGLLSCSTSDINLSLKHARRYATQLPSLRRRPRWGAGRHRDAPCELPGGRLPPVLQNIIGVQSVAQPHSKRAACTRSSMAHEGGSARQKGVKVYANPPHPIPSHPNPKPQTPTAAAGGPGAACNGQALEGWHFSGCDSAVQTA